MSRIKTLAWLDAPGPLAATGFGTVAKNVLTALHNSGKYDIDHLAINYHGQFYDRDKIGWQLSPARLRDPEDPHGCQAFLQLVHNGEYDLIWICNDLHVTSMVAKSLSDVLQEKATRGKKVPKIVYYYPVDCHVLPEHASMLDVADACVTYTDYGVAETLKSKPNVANKLCKIYHGTDVNTFRPLDLNTRNLLKNAYLKVDPDTMVFINVNRNSQRKQLAKTIEMFKHFKDNIYNNSIMYIHTAPIDTQLNLFVAVNDLGLSLQKDIVFPINYSAGKGYPDVVLNEFYNMADCYITTHLGEGWGLTVTEAMAAGTPVIAPRNTSMPEILGSDGERGFMYDCNDMIYIDNSGYRPVGRTEDILWEMEQVYKSFKTRDKHEIPQVINAHAWVQENTWDSINQEWLSLLDQVMNLSSTTTSSNKASVSSEVV